MTAFVYPAPNACWKLDATEYVLSGVADPAAHAPKPANRHRRSDTQTVTDVLRHGSNVRPLVHNRMYVRRSSGG